MSKLISRWLGWVAGGLLLALSGCIEQTSLVTVQPDGSGTIHLQLAFSPKLAGLMPGDGDLEAKAAPGVPPTPSPLAYDEAKWQAKAKDFGPGVRFVSGKAITTPAGWKGYTVDYAFDDISKVTLRVEEGKATEEGGPAPAEDEPGALPNRVSGYTFNFTKGAPATLVVVPTIKPRTATQPTAVTAARQDPKQAANERTMMRPMLAGMRITTTIAVAGKMSESSAKRADGDPANAVVMLDLNLDQLMKDDAAFQKLVDAQDAATPPDLAGLPGFRVEEQPVTVKFQ